MRPLRIQKQIYAPKEAQLTKEEYFRLLTAAEKQKNTRLAAVMQAVCGTGIRVSELKFFTVESVKSGRVQVKCKNKNRIVLIPSKLKKLLLQYAKQNGIASGMLFVTRNGRPLDRSNIWAQMKKLCRAAGVAAAKVFPHNLRKLFARTFYRLEKDVAKLADILGHTNINTTRIYILSTGAEHMERIERMGLVV